MTHSLSDYSNEHEHHATVKESFQTQKLTSTSALPYFDEGASCIGGVRRHPLGAPVGATLSLHFHEVSGVVRGVASTFRPLMWIGRLLLCFTIFV